MWCALDVTRWVPHGETLGVVYKEMQEHLTRCVLVLALASSSAMAERPNSSLPQLNWEQDVRTAWRAAVKADRPLLVFVTMDGCLYCEKMKRTTLQDRLVVGDLSKHFEPVTLNLKDAPEFVEQLQVKSFPTTVVIKTNGDVIEAISGYQTVRQMRERLHAARRLVAQEATQDVPLRAKQILTRQPPCSDLAAAKSPSCGSGDFRGWQLDWFESAPAFTSRCLRPPHPVKTSMRITPE